MGRLAVFVPEIIDIIADLRIEAFTCVFPRVHKMHIEFI